MDPSRETPFCQTAATDAQSLSRELATTSSGGDLELLLPSHISRTDVSRENGLKEDDVSGGTPLETFWSSKESAPPIRTITTFSQGKLLSNTNSRSTVELRFCQLTELCV